MKRKGLIFFLMISLLIASNLYASPITFNSISGTGNYRDGLNPLTDGFFPDEKSSWSKKTTWWMMNDNLEINPTFTFLFDKTLVEEVKLSVDNNDSYKVEYTADNLNWVSLFEIQVKDGESSQGMDTMSSDFTDDEYISSIDFSSTIAVGLRIFATGTRDKSGGLHSVGEFQAFGTPVSSNPEPTTMLLFGIGLLGLAGVNRRKK